MEVRRVEEYARGCGYRKPGGIYLMSDGIQVNCDRLPFKAEQCEDCGHTYKNMRGLTSFWPHYFLRRENDRLPTCGVELKCPACDPPTGQHWAISVGVSFYPTTQDFVREANVMGISKRVGFIPPTLKPDQQIYLFHPKCTRPGVMEIDEFNGIFASFTLGKIELTTDCPMDDVPRGLLTKAQQAALDFAEFHNIDAEIVRPVEMEQAEMFEEVA